MFESRGFTSCLVWAARVQEQRSLSGDVGSESRHLQGSSDSKSGSGTRILSMVFRSSTSCTTLRLCIHRSRYVRNCCHSNTSRLYHALRVRTSCVNYCTTTR
jgi:hypothetical protein